MSSLDNAGSKLHATDVHEFVMNRHIIIAIICL